MTQAFNLSQLANLVNTSGQLNAATGLFNQTPVANGGTGKSSVTSGALLLGAGTSAMTELAGTTPGTVIASSPTGWAATPAASVGGGDYIMNAYTTPATWTKPGTIKAVKVTVVGGGGTGATGGVNVGGGGGGGGGSSVRYIDAPAVPGPVAVTAGAGTNSFGAFASATGGSNGSGQRGGAGGSGSSGTANMVGSGGHNGMPVQGGNGGNSMLGGGGIAGGGGVNTASAGGAYGGGGGGGSQNVAGAAGAGGIVIVEEFY